MFIFSMDLAKIVIITINVYDNDYACLSETMELFIYIKNVQVGIDLEKAQS